MALEVGAFIEQCEPLEISSKIEESQSTLHLIQGSLSSRRIARQYPLLAGLHRAVDGALLGSFIAVALLSGLTLHWQYLWTSAFTRLDFTRSLSHDLVESTAMIERYLLEETSLPKAMVPTKVNDLLYLDTLSKGPLKKALIRLPNFSDLVEKTVYQGY